MPHIPFDKQQAEEKLRDMLERIREVNRYIQEDILDYRRNDIIENEADLRKTMLDIRYYLLGNYKEIDQILTDLDAYK